MRLFLSSENVGKYPEVLLDLLGPNKKLALNENAKDDWSKEDRKNKVNEHLAQFKNYGIEVEELDLRNYFNKANELEEKLKNFGGVFISGGNTFILRRAMTASGFDKILKERLSKDTIFYGGSSAGSCVCATSLRGIDIGDRPQSDAVPKNYPIKKTIWNGLDLVPYMIIPHYGSDWFHKEAEASIEYMEKHKLPYKILRDGQVIIIDGDKETFLK